MMIQVGDKYVETEASADMAGRDKPLDLVHYVVIVDPDRVHFSLHPGGVAAVSCDISELHIWWRPVNGKR